MLPMETLVIIVAIIGLTLSSLSRGQRIIQIPPPRPLCASQYALANYACARLPMNTVPPPSPIAPPPPPSLAPPPPDHHHGHDHDHDDDDDHDHDDDHNHDDDHDHDHDDDDDRHDHDRNHDNHDHNDHDHDNDNNNNSSNHHGRRRRRHHHHHHHHRHKEETFAQQECCKWLKQIDNECVCDLLVRLPPLLAKPAHNYTVFVDESCIITYTCGGRLIH